MRTEPTDAVNDDSIVCRLCNRRFRAISNTHLIRIHDLDPEHPVEEYKGRFGIERAECVETRQQQVRSLERTLERRGKLWTPERVRREIRRRSRRGEALNSKTIVESAPQLVLAARRFFLSWDGALKAAGLDADKIRRRLAWTRERILGQIRELARTGAPLNHAARHRRGDGLVAAARREFGSWDLALEAAGIDPESVRLTRRWTPPRILEAIRRMNPVPIGAEVQRRDPALFDAARRRWKTWAAAVAAAGRPFPAEARVRWTVPVIVAEIRRLSQSGESLKARDISAHRGSLWRASRREFGNWNAAARAVLDGADGEVRTVRDLIIRRYRRLLERGLAEAAPADPVRHCIGCGAADPAFLADLVPRTIRIRPACATCPRLLGSRNRAWLCSACAQARSSASGLYAWLKARHPADADPGERVPPQAELNYLRTMYECHRCAGTLIADGGNGHGTPSLADVDSLLQRS